MDDTTNQLRCGKCRHQHFDGNLIIHLGNLQSLNARGSCKLCGLVSAQLVNTWASQDSLVFLKPISESPQTYKPLPTYAIILGDIESKTVEGWISLSSKSTEGVGWTRPHNSDGNTLDREQIQRWLHECQSTHDHSSKIDIIGQDLVNLVLIDVQSGMLVDAEPNYEFAALSYVNGRWGGQNFNLDDFTKDELKTPNVLFSSTFPLPAVVRDAIDLVRDLGQRYLWCDFICIFKDNHAQKQAQIRQMDAIYGRAIFTIIALSAEHGNIGLAGVRKNSRDSFCPVVDLEYGKQAVAGAPELDTIRSRSVYSQRGWTFQEEVLSQRCIYLTNSQAYFTCPGSYKREDELQVTDFTRLDHWDLLTCFEQDVLSTKPPTEHLFSLYETLLREYNDRQLTYDTDILDAFDGIRKVLSQKFSTEFIYGLPQSQLHHALLWIPRIPLERRLEAQLEEQNDLVRLAEFYAPRKEPSGIMPPPTWSWTAWRGRVGFFAPLKEPFSAVSCIQHFGGVRQEGILPIDAPAKTRRQPLVSRLRPSFQKAFSTLWGDSGREGDFRVDDPSKLTAEKRLRLLSSSIPLQDLQLFILDTFRPGIALIHGVVHTLLEDSGEQPEPLVNRGQQEIKNALEKWESIRQNSLFQLDYCPPTSTEITQSWTAIKNDLTLAYKGRPIWPFRSWFRNHSTDAYSYVMKRLQEFLGTELRPHVSNVWLKEAMQRSCVSRGGLALTRLNALCFFTYSTSAWNFSTSGGQLYEPLVKYRGSMFSDDGGLRCVLETLQFSKHQGSTLGEVKRPVTALSIVTHETTRHAKADLEDYAGVLFDYQETLQQLSTDTRLLFLSSGPPYSVSGTLRHATWNMMLVRPIDNGFYERVAVGRFREDVMTRNDS